MAKTKVSKSQRVRDYMSANPDARNNDIVAALSSHGVTYNDVAGVRNSERKKAGKPAGSAKRRGRPPKNKQSAPVAANKASSGSTNQQAVKSAMNLIGETGGVDEAIGLLNLIRAVQIHK